MQLYNDSIVHRTETGSTRNQTVFVLPSYYVGSDAGRIEEREFTYHIFKFFSHLHEYNYNLVVTKELEQMP